MSNSRANALSHRTFILFDERYAAMKKNKLTLTLPLAITFLLMVLMVIYTSTLFYQIAVTNIYEVGEDKLSGISATIDNYLGTTKSVNLTPPKIRFLRFAKNKGNNKGSGPALVSKRLLAASEKSAQFCFLTVRR